MHDLGLLEAHNRHKQSSGFGPNVSCYMDKSNTRYTVKNVLTCISQVHDLAGTSFLILA